MRPEDYDARRIETRAMELIRYLGLEDEYGEKGGVFAEYNPTNHEFTLSDEAIIESWIIEANHRMTTEQWEDIQCALRGFTEEGCQEVHIHYYMR